VNRAAAFANLWMLRTGIENELSMAKSSTEDLIAFLKKVPAEPFHPLLEDNLIISFL